MNEVKQFFDSYPEAKDILPVSPEQVMIYLWENESNSYDIFYRTPSFPIVQQKYSQWFIKNILSEKAEQEEVKQAIIWNYRELFNKRVSDLLNFVGPKTETERLQDILAIRNEFFLYPIELESELLSTYKNKIIDKFVDISADSLQRNHPFTNFRKEAREKSQFSIASFDREKHLSPHFSGFVENIQILGEPIWMYPKIIFEAQWAYIQNGNFLWSIHSADSEYSSRPVNWNDSIVRWYSPNFVLEEVYLGDYREKTEPKLSSQRRIAKYRFDDPRIQQVTITQWLTMDKKEEFIIQIEKWDKTLIIHRATRAINWEIYAQLKGNSMYLSEIENVIRLVDEIQENEKNQKRPQ